jgi:2-polyprenyl-3-methyl-5-hydroxy-6-metoxy-1,4-benzoquinol methylase/class 3 adenylate cyclase
MLGTQKPINLLIADISGYTKLLMSHGKALAHGQMVVGELMNALMAEVKPPYQISRLEGDAVVVYADLEAHPHEDELDTLGMVDRWLTRFHQVRADLSKNTICRCSGCANIAELDLKIIGHQGPVIIAKMGPFTEMHGIDVIVAHRLMKNTVQGHGYVLFTDALLDVLKNEGGLKHFDFAAHPEKYDDIGEIPAHVAFTTNHYRVSEADAPSESSLPWDVLRQEIRTEYSAVAKEPGRGFHFNIGTRLTSILDYDDETLKNAPPQALESFAGTGNPFSMGDMPKGAHVVDIGCGAGLDAWIASQQVGPEGRVIGVDMTADMVAKAKSWADQTNNVEIRTGFAENIPVEDGWADVVISNGVFNLCPDKTRVMNEVFRILKPGGRIQFGDVVIPKPMSEKGKRDIDLWAG